MDVSKNEKELTTLLKIYSIFFLLTGILTAYLFSGYRESLLIIDATPYLCFYLAILSIIASAGIRKNNIFIDLFQVSLLVIFIYSFIKYLNSSDKIIFIIYAVISLTIFIVTLLVWRDVVIKRFGLKELSPTEALSFLALAEVVIGDYKAENYSFDTAVKDFDFYLSRFNSSQKFSVKMLYIAIQFFPLIFLTPPLTWMGIEERKQFIKKRFYNASGMLLTLMRSAKQLVYFTYYGNKPSFKSTGYKMFEEREKYKEMPKIPDPPELDVIYKEDTNSYYTDVVVIGSGAAGAVAAYHIAKNTGKKVTILERGKYFIPQKDFTNIEPEMIGTLYRDGGLEMTQDFDLAVLQGNCVGGSTTVNNGICFRTPKDVLDNWEKLGAKLDRDKLQKYFADVETVIEAKPINLKLTNGGANKFYLGAQKIGLSPMWFVTNFGECGGSGYCNIGCKYNRKLSMLLNYLPMAQKQGAQILADTEVLKIHTSGNKAGKISCKTSGGVKFDVNAKHVVIAAGAIASSGILLKSGIKRNVGTRLSFNITTPMMAQFPEIINSFDGIQMCSYIKGDGYLVETTFNPPGASALIMQGWFEELNERMIKYPQFATAAPVVGSEPNGKIKLSLFGDTVVDYDMTPGDFQKLKEGMKTLSRIFLAAGADCVLPSSYDKIVIASEKDLSKYDSDIHKPEDISLSSAHPQGGNPLSDNKDLGAVDTNFRVHGYDNLYVCDASIFPTGVMVNPQLSIMALSNYAADKISSNI